MSQLCENTYDAGNQRIALRENGSLRWLLGDHLGSTAYTVNGTTETSEVRYLPWGKDRFTSGQTLTSYKFTGQREEAGLGRQGLKPLADSGSWLKPNWGGGASPAFANPYADRLGLSGGSFMAHRFIGRREEAGLGLYYY